MADLSPCSKVLTPLNHLPVTSSENWSTWANGDIPHYWPYLSFWFIITGAGAISTAVNGRDVIQIGGRKRKWLLLLLWWTGNSPYTTTSVSHLSHHPHPNREVGQSTPCPYGDANDGFVVVSNSVCNLPRLKSYQYKNISITIVQVSMYDILVAGIFCCMYLYAHKARLNVCDE